MARLIDRRQLSNLGSTFVFALLIGHAFDCITNNCVIQLTMRTFIKGSVNSSSYRTPISTSVQLVAIVLNCCTIYPGFSSASEPGAMQTEIDALRDWYSGMRNRQETVAEVQPDVESRP